MSGKLGEYEHILKEGDQGWVLLKSPDLLGGYCVFNKLNSTLLCIESEEVNAAVCDRMQQLGFEVLESVPTLGRNVEVKRQN
jgi:hypothetical protein